MADNYLISQKQLDKQLAAATAQSEGSKRRNERDSKLIEVKRAALVEKRAEAKKEREALKERTLGYFKEYEQQRRDDIQNKRDAKAEGGFYKPAEPKVLFVVRIKGVNKMAPKPRKVMQLFRLLQLHNGQFVKVNKATLEMLKQIEPFVTYGYPTVETIRKLILKRGYVRVGQAGSRQRVRIQHNELIAENLGKYGIKGVEDMVHEIATCGPHFKECVNFLWTFKLKSPAGGFVCKRHGFAEFRKGDWGNRETEINSLIHHMI